jgi:hypothetical protein
MAASPVAAFDVLEGPDNHVYLAIADSVSVHYAAITFNDVAFDMDSEEIVGFHPEAIQWKETKNIALSSESKINSLLCALSPVGLRIVAGTKAQHTGASYMLDVQAQNADWQYVPRPEAATEVLQIEPAAFTPNWSGFFSLYNTIEGKTACSATIIDPTTKDRLFNYRVLTKSLGQVRSIYACVNPWR